MFRSTFRTMFRICLAALFLTSSLALAKKTSSEIPEKREYPLSTKISPCEDFHKYVCSEAESSFKLRDDRSRHLFAFQDSRERLLVKKMEFMKELPTKESLNRRTTQMRDYYMACMNAKSKTSSERQKVSEVYSDLNALKTSEQLITYINENIQKGGAGFVAFWPDNSQDNPTIIDGIIYTDFMELRDHKYYENKDLLKDYENSLVILFKSIEPKSTEKNIKDRVKKIIEFEKEFVKIFPNNATRNQRWSETRGLSQEAALKKYPHLKLQILFDQVPKTVALFDPVPEALEFLNAKVASESLQVLKDLYIVGVLSPVMDDAYPKYFQANFAFQKKYFGGPTKRASRQERCTELVTQHFSKEVDAALIDQLFPNFDEKKVIEVGEKIRAAIVAGLKENGWLSRDARKEAIKKIELAKLQLVKPKNDKEWDFVPERNYSKINAVKNTEMYRGAIWERNMKRFKEPAFMDAWAMSPLTVNAYFSASENKFVMPMGILQYPFYNKDGNIVENLGAVGAVVGHELGHSIDDSGSKYDSQGRLRTWMSTKDLMEFGLRSQKMIEQFNKVNHDGKLTLGENVADLVGLTFAYNAAFPKGKGSVEDKKAFYIAYGRLWCESIRPENYALLRKTDPHSSGPARINEQVKHQPAFKEVFQCKDNDKMILPDTDRVKIW